MRERPIQVLVVDDSAFMRRTISKHLEADEQLSVVGTARDGQEALRKLAQLSPDVVTLDVEMPELDGLDTLRRIMAEQPTPVVMLSSHTQQGARTTIRALMRGAVDFVPKPEEARALPEVMAELIHKIKSAAGAHPRALPLPGVEQTPRPPHRLALRPFQSGDRLVVIGASTGGPRALELLPHLPADLRAALVVVQHMPATFTQSLAQRLNESAALVVQEARMGDRLARGLALVAPGDYHLRFGGGGQVRLDQGPRHNHVRPSVDVTMISAAATYGAAVIGVVLTGMGVDGTEGARHIRAAGGRVLAESATSAVVYGMPRSVVEAGLAERVVPLGEMARVLKEWVGGGEPGI